MKRPWNTWLACFVVICLAVITWRIMSDVHDKRRWVKTERRERVTNLRCVYDIVSSYHLAKPDGPLSLFSAAVYHKCQGGQKQISPFLPDDFSCSESEHAAAQAGFYAKCAYRLIQDGRGWWAIAEERPEALEWFPKHKLNQGYLLMLTSEGQLWVLTVQ